MLGLLSIVAGIYTIYQIIKESYEKPIPAENWANKDLYYKDLMNGVPIEQCLKNVRNGKYKLAKTYPEPHRDSKTGKIIIENYSLYREDILEYDITQVYKWVEQGKYNLDKE